MKTHAVLAAVLLMLGSAPATATVRIANDTGGQIGPYLAKYRALRASGERVEIDGTCASACTMLLGIIPRNRICVTPRASLVFHSAWDMEGDQAVTSEGNRILWSTYPESVRRWIKSHGGLHSQTITLSGPELPPAGELSDYSKTLNSPFSAPPIKQCRRRDISWSWTLQRPRLNLGEKPCRLDQNSSLQQRLQRSVLLRRLSPSRSTARTVPATSCRLTMTAKADCTPALLPYSKI